MFAPNGGLVAMIQPPAVQGVGSYGGFQFELQDQGKKHHHRSRPRRPPDRRRQPRPQRPHRPAHHVLRQRSAGAGHHRSREGQGDEHPAFADHHHAGRVHGIAVRQRLRLQQPHLSRLCAGRSAVPHDRQGSAQLLRALRLRPDGPARQPRHCGQQLRSAGHQPLQPVPLRRNRRLARSGVQFRPGHQQQWNNSPAR